MAKLIQKILNSMKLNEENDDLDEDDFEIKPEPEKNIRQERPIREATRRRTEVKRPNFEDDEEEDDEEVVTPATVMRRNRPERTEERTSQKTSSGRTYVPMRSSTASDICIYHPETFDDSQEISQMLKAGRVIFLNFDKANQYLGQRIMDFVSGTAYALDATIHEVSQNNFIIAPDRIEITGDMLTMSEGFEVPIIGK